MTEKTRPVQKLRSGPVTAALWRHEGRNGPFYLASLSRNYKTTGEDGAEAWNETSSWRASDLAHVAALALRAQTAIAELDAETGAHQEDDAEAA